MIYSLLIIAFLALFSGSSLFVSASPGGSPICRATTLTDVTNMGPEDGSTDGFTFTPSSTTYTPGQVITFTVNHADNTKTFKGILAWAENPAGTTSFGSFAAKTGLTFGANLPNVLGACSGTETSGTTITHNSNAAKAVPFTLEWTAPVAGTGALKARIALVTTLKRFQFINFDLAESGAATTTTAAPGTTTADPGTATTTAAPVTTTTVGGSTTQRASALQSGPVMMIIGTMMAFGLAIKKIGF